MMYQRATRGSYDLWADRVGDDAYAWKNIKKYLDRSIHFTPKRAGGNASRYSTPSYDPAAFSTNGGPVQVGYTGYMWPVSAYAPALFQFLGMAAIPGFSSGHLDGYGYWQQTIDHRTGLRSSAESTFLTEAFGRPGLTAYINSMVRNIIFENGTAVGVNVTNNGQRSFTIHANKMVILSAGVWHSPQLLMVSGIGPRAVLDRYRIPIVKDLPGVGQNIHDTCNVGGPSWEVSGIGFTSWQEPAKMGEAITMLLQNHTGPLTNIGLDIGAFEKLPTASRSSLSASTLTALTQWPADWPELEYSLTASSHELLSSSDTSAQHASLGILLVAATSRGNMTITSASNSDAPLINPNWLSTRTDQEVAVAAYKRARKAFAATIGSRIGREIFPGENVTSDAELLEAIVSGGGLSPIHHASASCAMGKVGDAMAVVDSKARVFGTKRLRVIDASSFPFTPPGHTMGVVYGHAEKLVQDILDEFE
jgi:choline dehydrogenase